MNFLLFFRLYRNLYNRFYYVFDCSTKRVTRYRDTSIRASTAWKWGEGPHGGILDERNSDQ